jgi:hypothetical protein
VNNPLDVADVHFADHTDLERKGWEQYTAFRHCQQDGVIDRLTCMYLTDKDPFFARVRAVPDKPLRLFETLVTMPGAASSDKQKYRDFDQAICKQDGCERSSGDGS